MPFNTIRPTRIRLEASSVCQLRCPSCPTHSGVIRPFVGNGFLKLSHFQELLEANTQVKEIELSNYGEIFLNPDFLGILRYAHERGVVLTANDGVNFNRVSDAVLEGLVEYGLRSMRVSIDGASDDSYRKYRINGHFQTVMENIGRLNAFKKRRQSDLPKLTWQFIVFGHNEHEISQASEMAKALDMTFELKLSWDSEFSPVANKALLRSEIGAADREEYRQCFGLNYLQGICYQLWNSPQINWDGRVLGCCRNFWGDFGANAFSDGLLASVNSAGMRYARQMLLGQKPARDDIPCASCSVYSDMKTEGKWLGRGQIPAAHSWTTPDNRLGKIRRTVPYRGARFIYRSLRPCSAPRLASRICPIEVPLPPDNEESWTAYSIFNGHATNLQSLSCHASVLVSGACPHPPHTHRDEEILILLSGAVDLVLPDFRTPGDTDRRHLRSGQFVYYPANFAHTLQTTGEEPANYLMFKWSSTSTRAQSALAHGLFETRGPETSQEVRDGLSSRLIFEGPTKYLRKLHCHSSILAPGGGYDPHCDNYDVAILVLEGEVQTLGARVKPHGVVFYAAGEPHGMHNPGGTLTRYLVFEFHGRRGGLATRVR